MSRRPQIKKRSGLSHLDIERYWISHSKASFEGLSTLTTARLRRSVRICRFPSSLSGKRKSPHHRRGLCLFACRAAERSVSENVGKRIVEEAGQHHRDRQC